jgi:flagellar protein FliL
MAEPEEEVEISEEPEVEKKGKLRLWIILGAGLLLLGSVGFLTRSYFFGAKPGATSAGAAKAVESVKSTMNLDSFLVNLADADATRFVKVTFRLGMNEAKLGEELAGDAVVLAATRDTIISILSTKTSDDMLSTKGKEELRQKIREEVNKVLPKGKILEVYIMDFVVQL